MTSHRFSFRLILSLFVSSLLSASRPNPRPSATSDLAAAVLPQHIASPQPTSLPLPPVFGQPFEDVDMSFPQIISKSTAASWADLCEDYSNDKSLVLPKVHGKCTAFEMMHGAPTDFRPVLKSLQSWNLIHLTSTGLVRVVMTQ
jgi:hypothetical protein